MAVRPEVSLRLPNTPGALAAAFDTLGDARVGVEAWQLGSDATLRLVCDNPLLAVDLLSTAHAVSMRDVLTTNVATRDLGRVLGRFASLGANVEYAYPGNTDTPGRTLLVLGVADAARVAIALGI